MIRTASRCRGIRFVVAVVVCAMFVPFAGAIASAYLFGNPPELLGEDASHVRASLPPGTAEDDMELQDAGSSPGSMVALEESFAPEVFPPAASASIAPASVTIQCPPYLPAIFRPPIG